MSKSFEATVKGSGFQDVSEFNKMIAALDLSNGTNQWLFDNWRSTDGTKAGLLRRFPELAPEERVLVTSPTNTILLIHDMILEVQKNTHYITKAEFSVTTEGLQLRLLIHNHIQNKTYGIDHLFTPKELHDELNFVSLTNLRDRVLVAAESARQAQQEAQNGTGKESNEGE